MKCDWIILNKRQWGVIRKQAGSGWKKIATCTTEWDAKEIARMLNEATP